MKMMKKISVFIICCLMVVTVGLILRLYFIDKVIFYFGGTIFCDFYRI